MYLLIIDTCVEEGYVALTTSNSILDKKTFPAKEQSKFLLPYISELLNAHHLLLEQIDLIGVCIGPGAFTGVRVGVMTAKSLAFGANIPLVGFDSFAAYGKTDKVLVLPAKKDHFYVLKDGEHLFLSLSSLQEIDRKIASPIDSLGASLPNHTVSKVSYDISSILELLEKKKKDETSFAPEIVYLLPV